MKLEGDQTIPSELNQSYKAALTEKGANAFCKKRSPFVLPKMQRGQSGVTPDQQVWRARFKGTARRFKALPYAEKQRWFNSLPGTLDIDYYYNFYIYSSYNFALLQLLGVAGVIKNIQFFQDVVPTSGGKSFAINTVDPTKTIVVPIGNAYILNKTYRGDGVVLDGDTTVMNIGGTIDTDIADVQLIGQRLAAELDAEGGPITGHCAIVDALTTTQITIKSPFTAEFDSIGFSWQITEKKGRIVFPIITSITADAVVMDWSEVPDASAKVSIQVVEYI